MPSLYKGRYTLATKSKVDKVVDFRLCRRLVAVDIVANVEHVQLCRLCRKWVIFVFRISPECRTVYTWPKRTVDCRLLTQSTVPYRPQVCHP